TPARGCSLPLSRESDSAASVYEAPLRFVYQLHVRLTADHERAYVPCASDARRILGSDMTEPEPSPRSPADLHRDFAGGDIDVNALVQYVVRESYLQTTEDLRFYAEKVKYYNQVKKGVREYLGALRDFHVAVCRSARDRGIDIRRADEDDRSRLAEIFKEHTRPYDARDVACELSIPDRIPAEGGSNLEQLEAEIKRREEELNSIGDDAQLANVDLQNMLQKQQQTLQMMSNISKMLHDTAMSVIRRPGG